MRSRRFVLLACVLMALNLVLWLAPQGFALRQAVIHQLFGPKLVRADVIESCGRGCTVDMRIDRGVVVSATSTQLTVREADGRVQPIAISSSTHVVLRGGRAIPSTRLRSGWRVLVTWPANGAAVSVDVESRGRGRLSHGSAVAPLPSLS